MATFENTLEALGVRQDSLSPAQRQRLEREGFVVIEKLIEPAWLRQLQQGFERLYQLNREAGSRKKGTRHVEGWLEHELEPSLALISHPTLLAAAWQVIGRPFRLGGLHGREPLPGHGGQGLHADWGYGGDARQFHILNSLWLLDDFTADNGATRVVPGSQVQRSLPRKGVGSEDVYPGQQLVIAPAGSVLIFNGHLWHGGTRNQSDKPRRAIQCGLIGDEFVHLHHQRVDTLTGPISELVTGRQAHEDYRFGPV